MTFKMSKKELQDVLVDFKRKAYAGGGSYPYSDTQRGTKLHVSQNGRWTFYDEFAGDAYFGGWEYLTCKQEEKETGVWSMVYRGEILFPELDQHRVFDFLIESLKATPVDAPFRGPGSFKNERFPRLEYKNKFLGKPDITSGFGEEKIWNFTNEEQIYFGIWSGGLVLKNFDDIRLY